MSEQLQETEINKQALTLFEEAKEIIVKDQTTFVEAGAFRQAVKKLEKVIVDYFAPIKSNAYATWKGICAKENEALAPVQQAEAVAKKAVSVYLTEQARLQAIEQAKLEAEAKAKAEKERERLFRLAEKAEIKGNQEKAEELLEQAGAVYEKPVFAVPEVPKTTRVGNGTVTAVNRLEVTITDPMALLKEVVSGHVPITIVEFKEAILKSWVKSAGITIMPGIIIQKVIDSQVRGGK